MRPILTAILLLLTACSGSEKPGGTDPTVGGSPEAGELSSSLLTKADLPPGWEEIEASEPAPEEDVEARRFCDRPVPNEEEASGTEHVQFTKDDGTTLLQSVTSYRTPEDATEAFDHVEETINTCKTWELTREGVRFRLDLSSLPFPNVADETVAARTEGEILPTEASGFKGSIVSDTVIVRHENLITVVRHFALGFGAPASFEAAATEPLVRSAVDKLLAAEVS